jgi:hypothetical protein
LDDIRQERGRHGNGSDFEIHSGIRQTGSAVCLVAALVSSERKRREMMSEQIVVGNTYRIEAWPTLTDNRLVVVAAGDTVLILTTVAIIPIEYYYKDSQRTDLVSSRQKGSIATSQAPMIGVS